MAHFSFPPGRRAQAAGPQWSFLDLISAVFIAAVVVFLVLIYTSLGNPLAASSRRTLVPPATADPLLRERILALLDSPDPSSTVAVVDACPAKEVDNMPCEDPRRNSQFSREMNYYRERHCPLPGEMPLCLVPPPNGYRISVPWPESLHKIWHDNMPYNKIADRKGHQGWMKEEGPYFIFPGGGTMFPDGAEHYISKLGQFIPINKGIVRTALDMGCGVASFGGFLLKENIMALSFAPRDSHKSQIQFALERGIPAFVAMLGTRRLPFPAYSFDFVHCSRCLIPFTAYNGTYLIEVDRLLRPEGYLVISGPPVKWSKQEKEWADLQALTHALCYKLIVVDGNTAIWKKPSGGSCPPNLDNFRLDQCSDSADPNEAWYIKLRKCVTKLPISEEISIGTIPKWPERLFKPPARVSLMKNGIDAFEADTQSWIRRVAYYKKSLGVKLGTKHVRNVMDMNALFGGFAAALNSDPVWVMNVIPAQKQLTLNIIYDRGLIGVYHDWCEAFSTYPRTYDLIHVSGINSLVKDVTSGKDRCSLVDLMVEMDRMLRPEGTAVVRDSPGVIDKVARIALAIQWTVKVHKGEPGSSADENILVATKTFWTLAATSE
ncbi:putative methyltransferase PMT13 [Canna indica]|uniref:Methyltransferase n=1 Tax=Canna indica TaxID=4628 RepID=A0AAQ3KJR8_9LILI|nr:putative methyltransferase PMT13 [Canna indica]